VSDDPNRVRAEARRLTEEADRATRDRLLALDADVAAAQVALDDARKRRAEGIARAMEDDGWTLQRIGDTLGITRQRVGQLRRGE